MTLSVKKTIAVFLAVLMLTLASCGFVNKNISSFIAEELQTVMPVSDGAQHIISADFSSFVVKSGFISMYYDKNVCAPIIADVSGSRYWSTLPVFNNTGSSVLSLSLVSKDKRVILNSQDNSIAYASYSVHFNENGYVITYYMSDNPQTVKKAFSSLNEGELYVSVPVVFELTDGNLRVTVNCAEIQVSAGWVLEYLDILPYFGAVASEASQINAENKFSIDGAFLTETSKAETENQEDEDDNTDNAENNSNTDNARLAEEDTEQTDDTVKPAELEDNFLLVPDGSGAVMYTSLDDETTRELEFYVYSSDDLSQTNSAVLGAYGIKKQEVAVAAIIDEGDTLAKIKAVRASADSDKLNRVYSSFSVTPTKSSDGTFYYSNAYTGSISVCYRFMSGSEANYVSMASACREELIRKGVLSSKTVSEGELPLNISVIGSADGTSSTTTATFDETEDMLSVLKAKGINNINLILQGIFSGGLNQKNADDIKLLRNLGSANGFEQLCDYSQKQEFNIFAGVNLLSQSSNSNKTDTACDITGKQLYYNSVNPLSPYIGSESYALSLNSAKKVEDNAVALMTYAKELNIAGFCINDVAHCTYTDYSSGGMSRESFSDLMKANVAAFSTNKMFMLDGCNFNTVKSAYCVTDAPLHTAIEENDAYKAVPFVPVILHSTLLYSGKPANSYPIMQLELLKTVEYGAVPYFNWVFSEKSHLYYGNTLNEAVLFSLRATKDLSDLSTDRIVSHECIQSGFFCTGYDSGSLIYVNYNNYSVVVGEISVPPFDYLRIN